MITNLHGSPTPETYTGTLLCPTDAVKLAHRLKDATIQRISAELEQQRLETPMKVMISAYELWLLEVFGMTLDFESGFVSLNEVPL